MIGKNQDLMLFIRIIYFRIKNEIVLLIKNVLKATKSLACEKICGCASI